MNYTLPPDEGKKKRSLYWNVCIVLGIIAVIFYIVDINQENDERGEYKQNSAGDVGYLCADGQVIYDPQEELENDGKRDCDDGSDEPDNGLSPSGVCGGLMCCGSLIFAFSALSTKNDTQRVVVVQQQPQYVPVVQQVVHQPVIQSPSTAASVNPRQAPPSPKVQAEQLIKKAKNFELARNWEQAATAYEKAGMFAEAGRIRQEHLEQTQPVVQIGQVGNTVLNDSVMISDNSNRNCPNCGNAVEPTWNICPNCTNQL
jgi:hypothetical protein